MKELEIRGNRRAERTTPFPDVPEHLRGPVDELIDLTILHGRIDLGRNVFVATELSKECRCSCSCTCLITGPATIKAGASATFKLTDIDCKGNSACHACSHQRTDWSVAGGTGAHPEVKLLREALTSVEVSISKSAPLDGSFQLIATPVGTCRCEGTEQAVDCTGVPNTATVRYEV